MKELILALDQATNRTGYAKFIDGKLCDDGYGIVKLSNEKDYLKRIVNTRQWLVSVIESEEFKVNSVKIGVEEIQLQENLGGRDIGIDTFKKLAHIQGVILEVLVARDIPYELVYASQWKKVIGVDGMARAQQKAEAAAFVKKTYGIEAQQDICDAICIGHYMLNKEFENKQLTMETMDWSD